MALRFRLWHRLFLALALLSVAALAGFAAWQQLAFERGFLAYLDESTLARLAPAATRLADAYAERGDWSALRGEPRRFHDLVDAGGRLRPPFDGRPPPRGPRDGPPGPPPGFGPAPPPRPGMGADAGDVLGRLALFDARNARVVGRPSVPDDAPGIPVEVDGERVGMLRLARLPHPDSGLEEDFARAQARSAVLAALVVVALASLLAWLLARRLLRPVQQLAHASRALARGELDARVPAEGHDEFAALAQDFNGLAATLAGHRDARRRWGADIAHELRTPLSVLRAEVHALRDGMQVPDAAAFDSLDAECARLESLVEDLYQLSLADAGAIEYSFEPLDAAELVESAADAQRRVLAQAGLALEVHVAPGTPAVRGDHRRLSQLLANLLENSRRYTDAPGRVAVSAHGEGGDVVLTIDDSAPGVPPAARARLFERLYRVDASRSRAAGGAGLGLSIAEAIVSAHGGRIAVEDSPLGGLRVVVRLPAAIGAAP